MMRAKSLVLLIVAILASITCYSQIEFKNSSSADIKVTSIDGLNTVEVASGQTAFISFLKEVGNIVKAKIQHSSYQLGNTFIWVSDGEMSFVVQKGVAVFKSPGQKQASVVTGSEKFSKKWKAAPVPAAPAATEKKFVPSANALEPIKVVSFIVKNCGTVTMTGYGIFRGVCLKAGKATSTKITAPMGLIQGAFGYDTDNDSIATGANLKWGVLNKAITENMDTLRIFNENLKMSHTGELVTKKLKNKTNIGFQIISIGEDNNSKNIGNNAQNKSNAKKPKTISPNKIEKYQLYTGLNVIVVQYLDNKGLPVNAPLTCMVTKDAKMIYLQLKESKESVSPDNLQFTE